MLIRNCANQELKDNSSKLAVDCCTTEKARASFEMDAAAKVSEENKQFLDSAIKGITLSPVQMKSKVKPESKKEEKNEIIPAKPEQLNGSYKEMLYKMLRKVQTYGVNLGAHSINPHVYSGKWMDNVRNVAELTEALSGFDEITITMMIFNLLFPFEGKLPPVSQEDSAIPELFGYKKIASPTKRCDKKECERLQKELDEAAQLISKLTAALSQLEQASDNNTKSYEKTLKSNASLHEEQVKLLKQQISNLSVKKEVKEQIIQAEQIMSDEPAQAACLTNDYECIACPEYAFKQTATDLIEIPTALVPPAEDSKVILQVNDSIEDPQVSFDMIEIQRAILRIVLLNKLHINDQGSIKEQLIGLLKDVPMDSANEISVHLFSHIENKEQAMSTLQMIYEDACSHINSVLMEIEKTKKVSLYEHYLSMQQRNINYSDITSYCEGVDTLKLQNMYSLLNYDGKDTIELPYTSIQFRLSEITIYDQAEHCFTLLGNKSVLITYTSDQPFCGAAMVNSNVIKLRMLSKEGAVESEHNITIDITKGMSIGQIILSANSVQLCSLNFLYTLESETDEYNQLLNQKSETKENTDKIAENNQKIEGNKPIQKIEEKETKECIANTIESNRIQNSKEEVHIEENASLVPESIITTENNDTIEKLVVVNSEENKEATENKNANIEEAKIKEEVNEEPITRTNGIIHIQVYQSLAIITQKLKAKSSTYQDCI